MEPVPSLWKVSKSPLFARMISRMENASKRVCPLLSVPELPPFTDQALMQQTSSRSGETPSSIADHQTQESLQTRYVMYLAAHNSCR